MNILDRKNTSDLSSAWQISRNAEKVIPLLLKLLAMAFCAKLLVDVLDVHSVFPPKHVGVMLMVYDAGIILPLHEGGHLLFKFFGTFLYAFGGSFWQVMFPLLLFGFAVRERSYFAFVWIALAGVHLADITSYIYDAPYQSLPLLGGKRVGHDWHFLLLQLDALDWNETLSSITYYGGALLGSGGVAGGVIHAVYSYIRTNTQRSTTSE